MRERKGATKAVMSLRAGLASLALVASTLSGNAAAGTREVWRLAPSKTGWVEYRLSSRRDRFGCRVFRTTQRWFTTDVDRGGLRTPPELQDDWMKVGAVSNYAVRGASDRCYRFDGLASVGRVSFETQDFAALGDPGPRIRILLRADVVGNGFGILPGRPIPGFEPAEFQGNRCAYFALGLPTSDWTEGQRVLPAVNADRVMEPIPQQPQVQMVSIPLDVLSHQVIQRSAAA